MNVYDTANKLAKEIRESEEYKLYKKLKDEIMSNPTLKKKIEEFEQLRYEVQLTQYTGENRDEEKTKKLEEMYAMLVQDEQIKNYFDLEVKFNVMIADVNNSRSNKRCTLKIFGKVIIIHKKIYYYK